MLIKKNLLLTERETIAWTGCTRVQLDRCLGMSTWWDAPLTSRSLTNMQSLRAVLQRRLASCPAPSSTLPRRPLTWTWLPRSEKTLCLKSGAFPLPFLWRGSRNQSTQLCVHFRIYRKREEEKKREVLTNPVKMKKIKEMVKPLSMGLNCLLLVLCYNFGGFRHSCARTLTRRTRRRRGRRTRKTGKVTRRRKRRKSTREGVQVQRRKMAKNTGLVLDRKY